MDSDIYWRIVLVIVLSSLRTSFDLQGDALFVRVSLGKRDMAEVLGNGMTEAHPPTGHPPEHPLVDLADMSSSVSVVVWISLVPLGIEDTGVTLSLAEIGMVEVMRHEPLADISSSILAKMWSSLLLVVRASISRLSSSLS